jgi:hypothetical protein
MYVATCNDIEMDEQINDLLKWTSYNTMNCSTMLRV